jgi:hypothetical protein
MSIQRTNTRNPIRFPNKIGIYLRGVPPCFIVWMVPLKQVFSTIKKKCFTFCYYIISDGGIFFHSGKHYL